MLKSKQKGFTLLELLVVITLLAVLSVGALVAYEGIGDNAQATAASNNTAGTDRAIRNFKAVTLNYPDQFDNLVVTAGGAPDILSEETKALLVDWTLPAAGAFKTALATNLANVGLNAVQTLPVAAAVAGVEPNLQHNEGANPAAVQTLISAETHLSILPTFGTAACSVNGVALPLAKIDTATTAVTAADGLRQNVINDNLESDECQLILALGFGHDAAHSTSGSSVAISTAPTYVSKDINPATNYARYIALFHAGADGDGDNDIVQAELLARPNLIAVMDTEGHIIDENIANQNPAN